jgi:hypothetical protein
MYIKCLKNLIGWFYPIIRLQLNDQESFFNNNYIKMSCDHINDLLCRAVAAAGDQSDVIASLRAELAVANARIASLTETERAWKEATATLNSMAFRLSPPASPATSPPASPATSPPASPATSPTASILTAVPAMLATMEQTPTIAIMTGGGGAVAKKRGAPTGPRPIPAAESRCMARIGEGDGTCQCKHSRKVGYFCGRHAKQVLANPDSLQFTPEGKRDGLFYGRIDEERPQMNAKGEVCELWGMKMDTFPAGTKWHTSTPMFKAARKMESKVAKAGAADGVVAKKTPYHNFLAKNSAAIKEGLLRTSDSSKLGRGEFSSQAGKIWTALSAEQKATFAE